MNSEERTKCLRIEMLKELEACGNHASPQQALINAMYAIVMPPPTKSEVLTAAQWLEGEDYILKVNDSFGGAPLYRITTNGRAAIHA